MIPKFMRAPVLCFPQHLLMRCGAVLFGGSQFGECSEVTMVFVFPLLFSLLSLICHAQALSLWVLGGGGTPWWSGGIQRWVSKIQCSLSFPRGPGIICCMFSLRRFWSRELGENGTVSPVSSHPCQVSSGPCSCPVALQIPHREKEVSWLL